MEVALSQSAKTTYGEGVSGDGDTWRFAIMVCEWYRWELSTYALGYVSYDPTNVSMESIMSMCVTCV
jgi:hypothetical protein